MMLLLFNDCFESVRDVHESVHLVSIYHYISYHNKLMGKRWHISDVRQISGIVSMCRN
jgi:hypothetical protein